MSNTFDELNKMSLTAIKEIAMKLNIVGFSKINGDFKVEFINKILRKQEGVKTPPKVCKQTEIFNPDTGKCVLKSGKKGKELLKALENKKVIVDDSGEDSSGEDSGEDANLDDVVVSIASKRVAVIGRIISIEPVTELVLPKTSLI